MASLTSFLRVIRGFAEGSLVALGFGLAILLIGSPLALLARGVYEGLSWLARLRGETSALLEAFVYISSVVGTVILVAVLVRLLVGFFNWRRRIRGRVSTGRDVTSTGGDVTSTGRDVTTRSNAHEIAEAA
jgi:hypothetical protein